jgi:predicted PurR-regulated permease PerM
VEDEDGEASLLGLSNEALLVFVIRIVCIALLADWSLVLIKPFVAVIVWSVIIAVAIYPVFTWLSLKLHGRRKLAAVVITLFGLFVVLGPVAWLGVSLVESTQQLSARFGSGTFVVPAPIESVRGWPLIGQEIYDFWLLASTNLRELLVQVAPQLKPLGARLLGAAGSLGLNLVEFVVAAGISGFLLIPGPALVQSVKNLLCHVAAARGEAFVDLAGATIRNVSRGVIGIALLQTLLAGVGLLVAGIPAAGLFSFLILLLGIVQIGPAIIIFPLIVWSWFRLDATMAALFTIYMLNVSLFDNVLRPLVMAKGLNTPMLVIFIGAIGGTLAHGLIGLFVGPIVLSIAWQLLMVWTRDVTESAGTVSKS